MAENSMAPFFKWGIGNLGAVLDAFGSSSAYLQLSRTRQVTIQTRLIKRHGLGTVSIKQLERSEINHVDPFCFSCVHFLLI